MVHSGSKFGFNLLQRREFNTLTFHLFPCQIIRRNTLHSVSDDPGIVPVLYRVIGRILDAIVPSKTTNVNIACANFPQYLWQRRLTPAPYITERRVGFDTRMRAFVNDSVEVIGLHTWSEVCATRVGDTVHGPKGLFHPGHIVLIFWMVDTQGRVLRSPMRPRERDVVGGVEIFGRDLRLERQVYQCVHVGNDGLRPRDRKRSVDKIVLHVDDD